MRNLTMDRKLLILISSIKQAQKKSENLGKVKPLKIELVKIKSANIPNKLQNEMKEINKRDVIDLILHEIKNDVLRDYTGEIERIGILFFGERIRNTHTRYRNIIDFQKF